MHAVQGRLQPQTVGSAIMGPANKSQLSPSTFWLMGIPGLEHLHVWIGIPFCSMYMVALMGNVTILAVVRAERTLHEPMFLFLCMLSVTDLVLSTSTLPRMLCLFWMEAHDITFDACLAQMFFIHSLTAMESGFFFAMAIDRYVAICKPLHYMTIMDRERCNKMLLGTWIGGFLHSIIQVALVVQLPFCGPNEIDHYFCDVHPVLKLACTDTYIVGIFVTANSGTIALGSFVILLISYTVILMSPSSSIIPVNGAPPRRTARANPPSSFLCPKPGP